MTNPDRKRYDILKELALAGSRGVDLAGHAQMALEQAAEIVNLQAAAIYLWNPEYEITTNVAWASEETAGQRLKDLESDLFGRLRAEKDLVEAYLSFSGDSPFQAFTVPLRASGRVFGAVLGVRNGEEKLLSEEPFLEALSAALALNAALSLGTEGSVDELVNRERQLAIQQIAASISHEINNPLTAVLGMVQLVLRNPDTLDEGLVHKLSVVEEQAKRIRDIVQILLTRERFDSTRYVDGVDMIDLTPDQADEDEDTDDTAPDESDHDDTE